MDRVRAYIDGFNLYFGLKEKHGRSQHWLDVQALVESLLKPDQMLDSVVYFTARVRNQPQSELRQSTYLDALAAHCNKLVIVEGRFQEKDRGCRSCQAQWKDYEEKETDVSVAVTLVEDAVNDAFDHAMLVSADSDLCPAVRATKRLRPDKRIIAAFPPKRHSNELRRAVDATFTIGSAKVRQAQLPTLVVASSGRSYSRPVHWK